MKSHTKRALRAMPATQVQISMPVQGVLRDVRHAFLGLCIDAGQRVLAAMMEDERVAVCGAKGVPDEGRHAVRGGSTCSRVVLGGQRIAVRRLRARSLQDGELALTAFGWAAATDPLNAATLAAIASGVSTRRYAATQEPVAAAHRPSAASKSAVSRRFVQLSAEQLDQWLSRRLDGVDLPVVMVDGIHFHDSVVLVALGIDAQGNKHVLGLREGSSEATRVVASLLADLLERGLDADRLRLWVIDGGKALRRAIVQTFGARALVQRCQEHKRRNVIEHLPRDMHASVNRALRDAWSAGDAELAKRQLQRLAASLQARHPGRGSEPSRGSGGDAHGARAGDHRRLVPNPAQHQPDREPKRPDRALHAQRQALEGRSDGAALGRKRAGRCGHAHAQAARLWPDEDLAHSPRLESRRARRAFDSKGRVASRMRSRHPAGSTANGTLPP